MARRKSALEARFELFLEEISFKLHHIVHDQQSGFMRSNERDIERLQQRVHRLEMRMFELEFHDALGKEHTQLAREITL